MKTLSLRLFLVLASFLVSLNIYAEDNCVAEGKTVPAILNPPQCCDKLVLVRPEKPSLGAVGTCEKKGRGLAISEDIKRCVGEGKTIPALLNPPKCCEGLVQLRPSSPRPGVVGVCEKRRTGLKVPEDVSLAGCSFSGPTEIQCADGKTYKLSGSTSDSEIIKEIEDEKKGSPKAFGSSAQ